MNNNHLNGTQIFIMPRSVPSGYDLEFYDLYVDNLTAKSSSGNFILIKKESTGGPRWILECSSNETLSTISYSIDLTKHEQGILSAGDSSKIRQDRYIGILGYSIYGYLEQMDNEENFPIMLIVQSPPEWPIHLTLPSTDRLPNEQAYGIAKNYYHLADSQIYMGPNISFNYISIPFDNKLSKIELSFYVIVYTEDSYNLDINMFVDLSVQAMKNVLLYYNSIPFLFYTVALEMIKPLDNQHSYGFSMEHLNSCTINIQYGSGINRNSTQDKIKTFQYNLAHHIQHAWLPKRLFSNYYYPFTFELTPVIDTIWFNEV
jgi:predicted metalloprotease with PDZ domain